MPRIKGRKRIGIIPEYKSKAANAQTLERKLKHQDHSYTPVLESSTADPSLLRLHGEWSTTHESRQNPSDNSSDNLCEDEPTDDKPFTYITGKKPRQDHDFTTAIVESIEAAQSLPSTCDELGDVKREFSVPSVFNLHHNVSHNVATVRQDQNFSTAVVESIEAGQSLPSTCNEIPAFKKEFNVTSVLKLQHNVGHSVATIPQVAGTANIRSVSSIPNNTLIQQVSTCSPSQEQNKQSTITIGSTYHTDSTAACILELLNQRESNHDTLQKLFLQLKHTVMSYSLPKNWYYLEDPDNEIHWVKISAGNNRIIQMMIALNDELLLKIHVHNCVLPVNNIIYKLYAAKAVSGDLDLAIRRMFSFLSNMYVCPGAFEDFYQYLYDELAESKLGNTVQRENNFNETYQGTAYSSCIRSQDCELLLMNEKRCKHCYKVVLWLRRQHHMRNKETNSVSVNKGIAYMSRNELVTSLHSERRRNRSLAHKVWYLQKKLAKACVSSEEECYASSGSEKKQ